MRKFQHDPQKILGLYIKTGMTVMDYEPAVGYFSIPVAKMSGIEGKVYCVDIQEKMLEKLEALSWKIPALIRIEVGIDFSGTENSGDIVLYSEFESREQLDAYCVHPEHKTVIPFIIMER